MNKKLEIKGIISLYALVFNIIRVPNSIAFNAEFAKLLIYPEKNNIRFQTLMCVTLTVVTAKIYFY
jgi:hypothetical protein